MPVAEGLRYNRLESIMSPDGTTSTTTYGANQTSVTTTNQDISRTATKKYNAIGWLTESTDNGGNVVKNEYYCNGKLSKTYIMGQANTAITFDYDERGNRSLLNDPNYGQMTSVYNAIGELEQQTNPRNEKTNYSYNKLSQIISEIGIEGTTDWLYSTTPRRIGTLESITKNNHLTNYRYDNALRPISITETISGEPYTTRFTYDELGRLETTTHPTGITISEGYNQWGFHTSVKKEHNTLWETQEVNPLGMISRFKTGNGLVTDQTFHPLNMRLQTVKTLIQGVAPVQDHTYSWFGLGNLRQRKKGTLTESFTYDHLDRLKSISLNGVQTANHEYDTYNGDPAKALGNITKKSSDGQVVFSDATYGGSNDLITFGPHALSTIVTSNTQLTGPKQDIFYNGFDKVKQILEGDHILDIQYGSNKQRISQQYTDGVNTVDKVWAGACEFITKNGQLYKHTYLSGPMGVFAVHIIKPDDTEEINYIHKDHLGSWNTITDEGGNKLQELSFDAWGNRRDPATWRAFAGTVPEPLFDRGYTGHEHLYAVNLINMNGRVYDPIVSRMLSPDNFIQAPGYSQSLNRYSYCWNNPLKYTDPTGQELGVENNRRFFWWAHRGDSYSSQSISPGSGNHWSDQYRGEYGNYMLGNRASFNRIYGDGAFALALKVVADKDALRNWSRGNSSLKEGMWVNIPNKNIEGTFKWFGTESQRNELTSYEVINRFVKFGMDLRQDVGGVNIFSDWWNSHWTAKFIPDVIYLNVGVVVTTSIGYGYNWGYALQIRGKEGFGIRPFVTFIAKYGTHGAIGLNLGYSSYSGDSRNFSFHDSFYGEGTIASEVDYIYGIGASQSPLDNYGGVLRSYDLGMGYGIGASYNFFTGTSPY